MSSKNRQAHILTVSGINKNPLEVFDVGSLIENAPVMVETSEI